MKCILWSIYKSSGSSKSGRRRSSGRDYVPPDRSQHIPNLFQQTPTVDYWHRDHEPRLWDPCSGVDREPMLPAYPPMPNDHESSGSAILAKNSLHDLGDTLFGATTPPPEPTQGDDDTLGPRDRHPPARYGSGS